MASPAYVELQQRIASLAQCSNELPQFDMLAGHDPAAAAAT
jgi:hypothetical protein